MLSLRERRCGAVPFPVSVLLLAASLLLGGRGIALGVDHAPLSTPAMNEVFAALDSLEAAYESGRWSDAEQELRELEQCFPKIVKALGEEVSPQYYYEFGYSLGKLRSSFMSRDKARATDHFIEVHDLMLRLAARFAYDVPPALHFIDRYVERAEEAAENGEFDEVVSEMREIGRYFRGLYAPLEEKGVDVSEVWGYHQKINKVMAAAEAGSRKRLSVELRDLKGRTRAFVGLFLSEGAAGSAGSAP